MQRSKVSSAQMMLAMAEYLYRGSQLSLLSTTLLFILTSSISVGSGQTTGVFLSLNGVTIPNDGYVLASGIGTDASGLHCNTDRNGCCRASGEGHWYFPDGREVLSFTAEDVSRPGPNIFFSRNRVTGIIRLNRHGNPPERGCFRCEIPNASGINVTLYVNIVISVQVTLSSSTSPLPAGRTGFSLRCDVSGTGNLNSPTITYMWRREGILISDQQGQTLTLSPLAASHAGRYICEATVASSSLSSDITATSGNQTVNIQLPAPDTVTVIHSPISIGSTVTLTCTMVLSPLIDAAVTVNTVWTGPDGFMTTNTAQPVMGSTITYTSTAMVSSFGREQSGVYVCGASIDSAISPFLVRSIQMSETVRVTLGVYLSLRGTVYANNSVTSITEIGETDPTGLQCITDRMPCCSTPPNRAGQWYFPGGTTAVPPVGSATSFYRTRGDDGTVNLNRLNTSVMMPSGLFCCEVPNALDIAQRVCATITASISVQIRDNVATPTLGQSYSLTCEATGASSPVSTYQWRRDGNVLSETGPTLSFSPLRLFNAGQYSCQVTVNGLMLTSLSQEIRLSIPPPASVSITSSPPSPVSDMSSITVTCIVELGSAVKESELSLLMVSAQLSRDGTLLNLSDPTVTGTAFIYTRQFEPFGRRDSGNYTCTVIVRSRPTATYLTGSRVLSDTVKITVRVMVEVNFQLIANEDSKDINFSLSCNSTGGTAENVVWTRDGFFLHNTGPLVLTDATTLSYTNVLMVSDRTPGIYMCTIRGPSDQILSSTNFTVQASAPPVGVVATQSSSSGQVEVSWSHPADRANIITGYRIFYGNGRNLLFSSYVTSIVINSGQIESVSIRSESEQLPSELISVTVKIAGEQLPSEALHTCSSEIGIAAGGLLLVEGIIALVTVIIVVSCWFVMRQRKSGKSDFAVSANMAYGQVKLEALGDVGGEYEDPDRLARPGRSGGGDYEPTGCPAPYEFPVSKSEAPVYSTADESTTNGKTSK